MKKTTIFEKNLSALSARKPKLAERISEVGEEGKYRLINSKTDHPNLMV